MLEASSSVLISRYFSLNTHTNSSTFHSISKHQLSEHNPIISPSTNVYTSTDQRLHLHTVNMSNWIGPNVYRIEAYSKRKVAITQIGDNILAKYDPSSTLRLTSNSHTDARQSVLQNWRLRRRFRPAGCVVHCLYRVRRVGQRRIPPDQRGDRQTPD